MNSSGFCHYNGGVTYANSTTSRRLLHWWQRHAYPACVYYIYASRTSAAKRSENQLQPVHDLEPTTSSMTQTKTMLRNIHALDVSRDYQRLFQNNAIQNALSRMRCSP